MNPVNTIRRGAWPIGVWLLLAGMIVWYAQLIPEFGAGPMASLLKNGVPLLCLACAQGMVVIGGGVDLGVGSMMLLSSCTAAQLMDGQSAVLVFVIALGVVIGSSIVSGVVGLIVVGTKVPDIVVTLATSYILSGFALVVLPSPGGGTADELRWLFTGSATGIGDRWYVPGAVLAVLVGSLWWVLRRTLTGLSVYALGSDRPSAILAGVDAGRAKVASYALGGVMSGFAGVATVALTGRADARFSIGANATLNSVAAVVLGGVALTGGVGSILGVGAAALVLVVLPTILSALGVDPNNAQVIQGVLIAVVVMIGGLAALKRERAK